MIRIANSEEYFAPAAISINLQGKTAPTIDWSGMNASDHFVQFYEKDASLVNAVSGFIGAGIIAGDICLVIATRSHCDAIGKELEAGGLNLDCARTKGQYIAVDATQLLSRFMVAGSPDPQRFEETLGTLMAEAVKEGKRIRAFGEMVAVLWSEGNLEAAVRLEELWNDLGKVYPFCLFCAYSLDNFGEETHAVPFSQICNHHSHVIPSESYTALNNPGERLREIALLQQKAKVLEAEIEQRKRMETVLAERLYEIEALNARLKRSMTETHHRVKNSLQLVYALIDIHVHTDRDAIPIADVERLGANIQVFAIIHDLLTQAAKEGKEQSTLSIKTVLEQLVALLSQVTPNHHLTFAGDDVALPCRQATALAVVANELISNALKHGKRTVEVSFCVQAETALFAVSDDGPGFTENFDARNTMHIGLELMESLVQWDLRGTTRYESVPQGGRVTVSFPISQP